MSIKLTLVNEIATKLKEITEFNNQVRLFNNQIETLDKENVIRFPICLIELSRIDWDNSLPHNFSPNSNDGYFQKADIFVRLYVCFKRSDDETKRFTYIDSIVSKVIKKLNGLDFTGTSKGIRTHEEYDWNQDSITVWKIDFKYNVTDDMGLNDDLVDATDGGEIEIALKVDVDLKIDNDIIRAGYGE